mgnify:CR=1 FL=1
MQKFGTYIFGRNPVLEALNEPERIEKIFIEYGSRGHAINNIIIKAKKNKIPCTIIDKKKFVEHLNEVPSDKINHQGVIAILKLYENLSLEELLNKTYDNNKYPILIILDSIYDPHNLGAITRTAECAGASGLIITEKNSSPITATAIKASSGALHHIPISKVKNLLNCIEKLKASGYWIYGTSDKGTTIYTDKIYDRPIALIIGNEGKGISPSVIKNCDYVISIPIKGKTQSLNASVSTGIILYEILRQRNL